MVLPTVQVRVAASEGQVRKPPRIILAPAPIAGREKRKMSL
jgi:hypothetical protein